MCARQQRRAQDGVRDFGGFFVAATAVAVVGKVQEREVDVALRVGGEVGGEGEGSGCMESVSWKVMAWTRE